METRGEFCCLVLVILLLESTTLNGFKPPPVSGDMNLKECSSVQEQFVKDNLGRIHIVPDQKIHDTDMEICYRGSRDIHKKTCCSRKMERKYAHAAQRDLQDAISLHSASLKNLLVTQSAQLKDKYQELTKLAENNTHTLFNQVYKVPLKERREATQDLFINIQAFLKRKSVNVHETVSEFFDHLFPVVFHNILNDPVETELSDTYRECLAETRGQLNPHPFGDLPHKISHRLHYSLAYARTLFDAIDMGIETINTTDYMPVLHECTKGLTKLKYCSHCETLVHVKPCEGFCSNVMRGCLSPVLQVEGAWKGYVEAVEALVLSMNEASSLERTLQSLHSRISEAVMHAMEAGPRFYAQVIAKCGHPKTSKLKQSTRDSVDMSSKYMTPTKLKSSVTSQLESFVRELKAERAFFDHMPDQVCRMALFQGPKDDCWNGETVGSYTRAIPAYNLSSQLHNPEVRYTVGGRKQDVFGALSNKLDKITEVMKEKAKGEKMQRDGDWSNSHDWNKMASSGWGDDEDNYASGSGDGMGYDQGSGNGIHNVVDSRSHGYIKNGGNKLKEETPEDIDFGDDVSNSQGPAYKSPKIGEWEKPHDAAGNVRPTYIITLTILCFSLWLAG